LSGNIAAFFDVDGTITRTNVVQYYLWYRQRNMSAFRRCLDLITFIPRAIQYLALEKISRRYFVEAFYKSYRGVEAEDLRAWDRENFESRTVPRIFPQAVETIQKHRQEGHRIVFLTGGLDSRVEPLAERLSANDVLSVRLISENGRYIGRVDGSYLVDGEKREVAQAYASRSGIDLGESYAYGDSLSDADLLESVGHPCVVNPSGRLLRMARQKGWTVCSW
jgi:HAD superfamily hydrolase (TIGR01490 family)